MKNPLPQKRSQKILYSTLMVMLYLLGYSMIFNRLYIGTFASGIILGFAIGGYFMILKIQETKKELNQV